MTLPHIPFEACHDRARRARELMGKYGIDVLLITPSKNLWYLAGFSLPRSERFIALLFRMESEPVAIGPVYERERLLTSPLKMQLKLSGLAVTAVNALASAFIRQRTWGLVAMAVWWRLITRN